MAKIFTRMGDGWAAELSEAELMKDIEDGSRDADDIFKAMRAWRFELGYGHLLKDHMVKRANPKIKNPVTPSC